MRRRGPAWLALLVLLCGRSQAAEIAAGYSALHLSGDTVSGAGAGFSWPLGSAFRLGVTGTWHSGAVAGEHLSEWAAFAGPAWTPRPAGLVSPFLALGAGFVHSQRQIEVFGVALGPDGVCDGGCPGATAFAAELGGGLDVRLGRRFALRALEVDYRLTTLDGDASRLRFSVGLVFRTGR